MLLEEKDYVKFLGVPIDKNLTWRPHIDCIALKISKIVGTLAGLFKTSFTFQYSSSNLPLPEISLHAFRYGRTQNAEPYSMEYPMEYLKWSTPKSHVLVK